VPSSAPGPGASPRLRRLAAALSAVAALGLGAVPAGALGGYPVGVPRAAEPSGVAPPGPAALPGYHLRYVTDFPGRRLPRGWNVFTGVPGGDPGGRFGASHVVVAGGLLHLNAWRDPRHGGAWVTGGLCHCALASTYGAYFVRSRITGGGANEVQLLWPADNQFPPEIDFNENGGSVTSTSSSLHYGSSTALVKRTVRIDMEAWHTWGVIWTPGAVTYVVDGRVWARVTAASLVPHLPMRLDIEQRTRCTIGQQCPRAPVSMLVDWVAEYGPAAASPATGG
jgi:hypothetical protein